MNFVIFAISMLLLQVLVCADILQGLQMTGNESKLVQISTNSSVNYDKGITVCLRAQFQFWTKHWIFKSDSLKLGLEEYKFLAGFIELGEVSYNFQWPQSKIDSFTSFQSFCLIVDKISGFIQLTINGNTTLEKIDKAFIQKEKMSPGQFITVGYFSGLLTDLNVWNQQLTSLEVEEFLMGCKNNLYESNPPNGLKWSTAIIIDDSNFTLRTEIKREEICNSNKCKLFLL